MAGTYCIIDPVPALAAAMGGTPAPAPIDPTPYTWNAPDRNEFVVTADVDGIVARQRADPSAPQLYAVKKGSTFRAIALVPGNDGDEWFLATDNARIPMSGTRYDVEVG